MVLAAINAVPPRRCSPRLGAARGGELRAIGSAAGTMFTAKTLTDPVDRLTRPAWRQIMPHRHEGRKYRRGTNSTTRSPWRGGTLFTRPRARGWWPGQSAALAFRVAAHERQGGQKWALREQPAQGFQQMSVVDL